MPTQKMKRTPVPFDEDPFEADPIEDDSFEERSTPEEAKALSADEMKALLACDLVEFFGTTGPLARQLDGYELRPSQLQMAEAIKEALLAGRHALVEAPTGTGKSIAYLIPAILSGKSAVIATANKSLQSQLYFKDIPFLRNVMQRKIDAVVVKGRSNFVCTHKWEIELVEQERFKLYDKPHPQIEPIKAWLEETETGDIDDLPFLIDPDIRTRIVSYPDDCLHNACPHYEDACWVNMMRDRAAEAQLLVTNHHLLLNALELGVAGERILPPTDIYIIDEAHGLEQTATAVYETAVTDYTVAQLITRGVYKQFAEQEDILDELDEIKYQNTLAFQEISLLSRDNSFRIETEIESMKKLSNALSKFAKRMKDKNPYAEKGQEGGKSQESEVRSQKSSGTNPKSGKDDDLGAQRKMFELGIEMMNSAATKLMTVAVAKYDKDVVRYAQRVFDRRSVTLEVHAAPINPASKLTQFLFHTEGEEGPIARSVVCTSATLATDKQFVHFKQRCGLHPEPTVCVERVLPPVFDFPRQSLLYQPALPAYDYRNSNAFYDAAVPEIRRLLEVSRGRALLLFTSWGGLQQIYDMLNRAGTQPIWPMRAQGDAPRDALLTWFKSTANSVLLATRSFWEGVDIPGDDLSLVIVDKMPFPTPGDPLHSARMKVIDEAGRSSFAEYMTPLMSLALKQGFGRLIRRATDRGVVAILDERLTSKSYGRQVRADLPPARFSRDFKEVHKFFQESLNNPAEFALNVWAGGEGRGARSEGRGVGGERRDDDTLDMTARTSVEPAANRHPPLAPHPSSLTWRWQLVRLQDGKMDGQEGEATDLPDLVTAEVYAALLGLRDLRSRIEKAGRATNQFSVELRCSPATRQQLQSITQSPPAWRTEAGKWQKILF